MYYLDSCVCVGFLRGELPLMLQLFQNSDPRMFGIPAVVKAELLVGAEKSARPSENRFKVESFLLPFEIIPFDDACACEYARVRAGLESEGRLIGPNDMLIAATALAHDATLATHNTREFKRVKGLRVANWAEQPYGSIGSLLRSVGSGVNDEASK